MTKGPVKGTQIKGGRYYRVVARGTRRIWLPLTTVAEGLPAFFRALADLEDAGCTPYLIQQLVADWQRDVMPRHATKTQKDDKRYCAIVAEAFAKFTPADVGPADVTDLLALVRNKPRTHNALRTMVRELMRYAIQRETRQGPNPVDVVPTMTNTPRDRYITDSELRRIKVAAMRGADDKDTRSGPMLCALVDMAYLTGQRIGDLLALEWSQISDAGVKFKPSKTKATTAAKVGIEWTPKLADVVRRLKALRVERHAFTPKVFTTQDGQPYTYWGASTAWRRAVKRSSIKGLTFHDLRAKALTDKAQREGRRAAQTMGAHSTEGQTASYIDGRVTPMTRATR